MRDDRCEMRLLPTISPSTSMVLRQPLHSPGSSRDNPARERGSLHPEDADVQDTIVQEEWKTRVRVDGQLRRAPINPNENDWANYS